MAKSLKENQSLSRIFAYLNNKTCNCIILPISRRKDVSLGLIEGGKHPDKLDDFAYFERVFIIIFYDASQGFGLILKRKFCFWGIHLHIL